MSDSVTYSRDSILAKRKNLKKGKSDSIISEEYDQTIKL